jgi:hypothetical protein
LSRPERPAILDRAAGIESSIGRSNLKASADRSRSAELKAAGQPEQGLDAAEIRKLFLPGD